MHWIESLFGISPDGNSGATEAAFFLAAFGGIWTVRSVILAIKRHRSHRQLPR